MKIGLKKADVKIGGQFHDDFYDTIIVTGEKIVEKGEYVYIERDVPFSWVLTNIADIKLEHAQIYVEAPVSYLTVNVPAWLPERTWTDDQDQTQTHTFETWGNPEGQATEEYISRKSIDGTMMIIDLTRAGNGVVDETVISNIDGISGVTALTQSEARTLAQSASYSEPEV